MSSIALEVSTGLVVKGSGSAVAASVLEVQGQGNLLTPTPFLAIAEGAALLAIGSIYLKFS